ncbi:hypothetical protein EJB05_34712 [Eragrostis curvula]|uniref:Uncharacterized protein n=1 Tax=Eragrostis curvula TaxID=38414 RepID=A0A5J9U4V4_9POAL|nr:hypothetical protein EJB05_34712 [Eragrostis curvula]
MSSSTASDPFSFLPSPCPFAADLRRRVRSGGRSGCTGSLDRGKGSGGAAPSDVKKGSGGAAPSDVVEGRRQHPSSGNQGQRGLSYI